MAEYIDIALRHTAFALTELRRTSSPGALSTAIAAVWRHRLGPVERAFLMGVAVQATDPDDRYQMGFILGGPPPLGVIKHVASKRNGTGPRNGHRKGQRNAAGSTERT